MLPSVLAKSPSGMRPVLKLMSCPPGPIGGFAPEIPVFDLCFLFPRKTLWSSSTSVVNKQLQCPSNTCSQGRGCSYFENESSVVTGRAWASPATASGQQFV